MSLVVCFCADNSVWSCTNARGCGATFGRRPWQPESICYMHIHQLSIASPEPGNDYL